MNVPKLGVYRQAEFLARCYKGGNSSFDKGHAFLCQPAISYVCLIMRNSRITGPSFNMDDKKDY